MTEHFLACDRAVGATVGTYAEVQAHGWDSSLRGFSFFLPMDRLLSLYYLSKKKKNEVT